MVLVRKPLSVSVMPRYQYWVTEGISVSPYLKSLLSLRCLPDLLKINVAVFPMLTLRPHFLQNLYTVLISFCRTHHRELVKQDRRPTENDTTWSH